MAERVIRIVLDASDVEKGLASVKGKLKGTETQAKKTGESMRALRSLAGGIIGALGIRELTRYADSWTTIGNKIRLVTDGTAEYNAVQDELVGLAQRTRTDLEGTADLYSRVARSVDQFGASQRQVLTFTESVNQTLQISGATAAEAAGGTRQFAQGLQSAALRGDELVSVLENNNRLARVIAKEFGVAVGDLRKLGEEGKLVSDRVFKAVLNAGDELNREFATITPTLESAFTTIKTFATTVVGSFNEATGITEGLVSIFARTDEQTKTMAATVRDLGLSFREFVQVATVAVAGFVETIGPKFSIIQAEIVKIIAAITRDEDLFRAALSGQNEFVDDLDKIKAKLDAEFEAIRRNSEARRAEFEDREGGLDAPGGGGGGGPAVDPAAAKAAADLLKKQQDLLKSLLQQEEALAIASSSGRDYAEVLQDLKIKALAAANGNEAFAFDALGAAEEIRRLTAEIEAQEAALQADIDRKEEAAQITKDARTETEKLADEIARLQGFLDEGLISQETFDRSVKNLAELDDSVEDFFRRARENSQDILAGFLENGLQDIDDFARAFGEMLLKLASQALAAQIFKALFGDTGGGTSAANIVAGAVGAAAGGRQFGGGVQAGQAVGAAEGGRFGSEVFVPNVGGSIVPIGGDRGAAAAAAPPQVNLTNINTLDPSDITGAFNDGAGDTVLLNRITTKRQAFRRALGV
jgi:tape measure domain-containing protein